MDTIYVQLIPEQVEQLQDNVKDLVLILSLMYLGAAMIFGIAWWNIESRLDNIYMEMDISGHMYKMRSHLLDIKHSTSSLVRTLLDRPWFFSGTNHNKNYG